MGYRVDNTARMLGFDGLMGWQRLVVDVGMEVDSDSGLPAYQEVIATVMRQSGKTLLLCAKYCERCLREPGVRVAYTAQTGLDGRRKFVDDHMPLIRRSPLEAFVPKNGGWYRAADNTGIRWRNGSQFMVLSTGEESGHGKTLDEAYIDEAFADVDNRREQALLPTMATRPGAQMWNTSTAGTSASSYLKRKVEIGRAAVRAGKTSGIAYFEWAIPEDEDIDDPAVWARYMPAFGHTIFEPTVRHARETMPDGEFRRAFGNQWTETEERVIPAEFWRAVCNSGHRSEATCYAIDARADRSSAVVIKAGGDTVELVAARPGVDWLTGAFAEHAARLPIVVDRTGPASGQADRLEAAGHTVDRYDSLQVRKACGRLFDAVADGKVKVRTDERLDTAARNAAQRSTADSWSWNRDAPGGEMLTALSLGFDKAQEAWQPAVGWL